MLLKTFENIIVSSILKNNQLKDFMVEFIYDDISEFVTLNGFDKYSSERYSSLGINDKVTIQINSVEDNVSHFEKNCYKIFSITQTQSGTIYKGQSNFNNSIIEFKSKDELSAISIDKVISMRIN